MKLLVSNYVGRLVGNRWAAPVASTMCGLALAVLDRRAFRELDNRAYYLERKYNLPALVAWKLAVLLDPATHECPECSCQPASETQ